MHKPFAIEIGKLVHEARNTIYGNIAGDAHANAALRSIIEVGTSAGGARAKAVIAWNPATNEIRSGQSTVESDFSHWLLKFDGIGRDLEFSTSQNYGRIEYAYHLMAIDAGITMSECRLLLENGRAHFMTKRLTVTQAISNTTYKHMCAMSHIDFKKKSTNSYSQLFMTIRELNLPRSALLEAFRRMVFNLMARNCDDHSKNFSFLLKQGRSWELAPAYDLTFAYNPKSTWVSQHLMSVNGKFSDVTVEDLYAEADRFGNGEIKSLIKNTGEVLAHWDDYALRAGINTAQEVLAIRDQFWLPHVF